MVPGSIWGRLLAVLLLLLCSRPLLAADGDGFFDQTLGDLRGELQTAMAGGKSGLLIMFETEACPYCRRMRKEVLSRADVQQYFHRHFATFAVDILGDVPLTDPAGRETTEKRWAREARIRATPTLVFFGSDGRELARHTGALATGDEFLQLGRFVAEGHHQRQTFEQFRLGRTSP